MLTDHANSNNNRVGSGDSLSGREGSQGSVYGVQEHTDFMKPRPPASASAIPSHTAHNVHNTHGSHSAMLYNRQQSEPVTQEDFGFIGINGKIHVLDEQVVNV